MTKTYAEIIDETLAAGYTLSHRAMNFMGLPVYVDGNGCCCAVGRMCKDPQMEWNGQWSCLRPTANAPMFSPEEREQLLEPEYRGLPVFFLVELQDWHDDDKNWNENGLSEVGKTKVAEMLKKWCDHDS